MKRTFLFSLFLLCFHISRAKWSVGYYPYPYSRVEVTTNPNSLFFGGLRIQTNSFVSNLNTDFNGAWNFKRTERINCFTGAGLRINPPDIGSESANAYRGMYLMIGARVIPFEGVPALGLSFDLCPFLEAGSQSGRLESNLGIFWTFGAPRPGIKF